MHHFHSTNWLLGEERDFPLASHIKVRLAPIFPTEVI
jgi:hypothetical protein